MPNLVLEEEAIADYLEGCVKTWREHKNKTMVPANFEVSFQALSKEQKFAFMATFYIDAFQAVHDLLFDELVPDDV